MRLKYTYFYVLILFVGLTIRHSVFIVWEGEQALVTQFGEIIRAPITNAGVHFKIPYIQVIERQDRRAITWEGASDQVPTGDQRYVSVKSVAQWQIWELAQFIQTVQTIPVVRARLDSIINGSVRDVISAHELAEIVRINNELFDQEMAQEDVERERSARSVIKDQRDLFTVLTRVEDGREKLEGEILRKASIEAEKLGVKLIAFNITQLLYQESVEHTVHERMISERRRVAEKIRAVGRSEEARIRGRIAKDYQEIAAPAHRSAEETKGAADAEAIKVYAVSLQEDPEFYRFLRTMDAYRRGLTQQKGEILLSSQSSFFKAMKTGLEP